MKWKLKQIMLNTSNISVFCFHGPRIKTSQITTFGKQLSGKKQANQESTLFLNMACYYIIVKREQCNLKRKQMQLEVKTSKLQVAFAFFITLYVVYGWLIHFPSAVCKWTVTPDYKFVSWEAHNIDLFTWNTFTILNLLALSPGTCGRKFRYFENAAW